MESLTPKQIAAAVGGTLSGNVPDGLIVSDVCFDSRAVTPGCLFWPLAGDRADGHDYILVALAAGAAGFVSARESKVPEGRFCVRVEDTRPALGDLAAWYRSRFDIPVVAVTGSVGKTTTKDMIAAVLNETYRVLKTDGNFNNDLGLPQTLLRLNREHQIAVVELGMNHPGEISYLTRIARPDVAVITNVGDAHIENMGSREATLRAKAEIFEGMTAEGVAVLNGDDPLLRTLDGKISPSVIWCGTDITCDWRCDPPEDCGADHIRCRVHGPHSAWMQEIPGPGAHLIYPAAVAAAVGHHFGLADEEIRRGILAFEPTGMRMRILRPGRGITILNDAYNANPQSMRAAVDVLSRQAGRRIAVLGDMLELGEAGPALHRDVGQYLARAGVDCLITVGELGAEIAAGASGAGMREIYRFNDREEAKVVLSALADHDCTVLFKASRGMHFESLADALTAFASEMAT